MHTLFGTGAPPPAPPPPQLDPRLNQPAPQPVPTPFTTATPSAPPQQGVHDPRMPSHTDLGLVRRVRPRPQSGWRKVVHRVTGLSPKESEQENTRQKLIARVSQPVRAAVVRVVVVGPVLRQPVGAPVLEPGAPAVHRAQPQEPSGRAARAARR
ncbi:hypothetical protein A9X01_22125 [Mycobacterium asiaticum]|uniref:Uncharacterized protein n=1 Tax=Mycobacterium asiaticum TaxID=1790 RepID=A0A1A3C614_MYCAS|nr:hypothetical protein A9X01_22125 [Mycobacterium asiaticum]